MLNLCGFTYGIKGFLIAAPASLVASAVVFIILRYLFGESLQSWSKKNETWQALEAVVVSICHPSRQVVVEVHRLPKVFPSSYSLEHVLSHRGYIRILSLQCVAISILRVH